MIERPPFPSVIDSSMMATFRACPRKFELSSLHHWKPKTESVHLVAGKAFARGLEVARKAFYVEGKSTQDSVALGIGALLAEYGAFDCPEDSPKSATRTAGALEFYYSHYPLETDPAPPTRLPTGERAIEFSFLEPLDFYHPISGDPILYSGRFDCISDYAGGLYGVDEKTASQLGGTWSQQWDLRGQFSGYCWGADRGGLSLTGFIVRGVSILKTKYDTLQAITYRPKWQVERWYRQTLKDLARMRDMWERGDFDYNLDEACTSYGGCMFRRICVSDNPEPWLRMEFQRKRWDPVTREEEVLE